MLPKSYQTPVSTNSYLRRRRESKTNGRPTLTSLTNETLIQRANSKIDLLLRQLNPIVKPAQVTKYLPNLDIPLMHHSIQSADSDWNILRTMEIKGYKIEPGANLEGAVLERVNLAGAKLRGANLKNAVFNGSNLIGADLSEAILDFAQFRNCDLGKANLTNLKKTAIVDLSHSFLIEANLSGSNLQGAFIHDSDLSKANLSNADLRRASLADSTLRHAKLVNVQLEGADLSYANLAYADLNGTGLFGVNLTGALMPDGKQY